jgi:hypothetical protein
MSDADDVPPPQDDITEGDQAGDQEQGAEPPQYVKKPLSSKGDLYAWIFIACVAVFCYFLYIFWQKRGKALWQRITGSPEVDLTLYSITHRTREDDMSVYRLEVVAEEGFFDVVLDPPVIDDFEEKYQAAEEANHLDDEKAKDEETLRVREELWNLLKRRTAVTFELNQNIESDAPQIEIAYSRNCITDAKFRSFKAARDFVRAQFKEIHDIAEVLKPGEGQVFIRSVMIEVQSRNRIAQHRAELATLQQQKMRANDDLVVMPPGGIPEGTPMADFPFKVPEGKSEGDDVEFRLPAGMMVGVTIPDGAKAGDVLNIHVPEAFMDPEFRQRQEENIRRQQVRAASSAG